MSSDWLKIRHWNGSQNLAFEELCCQLAQSEPVPVGSRFTRKGTPDAGVECLWKLPNEDEWGWQAKFFVASLSSGEWRQVDGSVRTALEKHPRLKKYTICIPTNFPDARVAGEKSGLEKWSEHTKKWTAWANERGMTVDFVCWDEFAILSLLSRDEHKGRRFFWFSEQVFSMDWFRKQIEEATANAGPRYTPELNVDLPIARLFDGMGRTQHFYSRLAKLYGEMRRRYARCYPGFPLDRAAKAYEELDQTARQLLKYLEDIKRPTSQSIPLDLVLSQVSEFRKGALECIEVLRAYENAPVIKGDETGDAGPPPSGAYQKKPNEYRDDLEHALSALAELQDLLESKEAKLANLPALLIAGGAGSGKTHLLCDVAQRRLQKNSPSVLLLGEQFTIEEPWTQIIKLVGLNCSRDEFLGALDAAGSATGGRALILIDALNEGPGSRLWPGHLAGLLTALSRCKNIGIAITVRSSYESSVIPNGLVPSTLIRAVHTGFSEHEYQAMQTFFDYFGIQHPSVPLLAPEFQNPLFLKIFCQSLKNLNQTRIPPGMTGITRLLSFFLDSINSKLSRPDRLDFDPQDRPVNAAVNNLAQAMAANVSNHLSYSEARDIVNAVLPRDGFDRSLLKNLISEGLLAQERMLIKPPDTYVEIIRFAYERFTDHLVAKYLLDTNLDGQNPAAAFTPDSRLGHLFQDAGSCWRNKGLLEALCVQLPERVAKELPDFLAHCRTFDALRLAFVDSLVWRDPAAISEATLRYVNDEVVRYEDSHTQFLEVLLTIATYPEHPYNSRLLHRTLSKLEMADRDAWWSVYVSEHYGTGGAIDRLVDWAWLSPGKSQVSDDSALLAAVALAWLLTSSNRFLRDRATKALVSLLTSRIEVLEKLLTLFEATNDLYVAERLYAVAYGCALRSTNDIAVAALAKTAYRRVFEAGKPVPHILLRDYARGVIEVAMHRGAKRGITAAAIRPPYASPWPLRIPSAEELKQKYRPWQEGMPDEQLASYAIFASVMHDDFGRYIIGTNFSRSEFTSRRLGSKDRPTYKQQYVSFVRSLTPRQKAALRAYEASHRSNALSLFKEYFESTRKTGSTPARSSPQPQAPSPSTLRAKLGKEKYRSFTKFIVPYLKNPAIDEHRDQFDLGIAQRWILQRVLDLGWTTQRFGQFDRNVERSRNWGSEAHKAERIGKKYQWIAYHEFLALLTDNFEFRGDRGAGVHEEYEGPWQLNVRDIDPSVVIKRTREARRPAWWAPATYESWQQTTDDRAWIATPADLPDPKSLLIVTNPIDGSRWLAIDGWYSWEEPGPPEEDRFETERREIWFLAHGYLTRQASMEEVFTWAMKQDFMGRWMPENSDLYKVFLGEFCWAPSFRHHDNPYHGHEGWTQGRRNRLPAPVLSCAEAYLGESTTRDCSVDDTLHIALPPRFILEGMSLRWNGVEGHFYDAKGSLTAFDPSVESAGPRVLLMREQPFIEFLARVGCDLFWTLLGEKGMIGGGHISPGDWKGRLELSGAFRRTATAVEGAVHTKRLPGVSR